MGGSPRLTLAIRLKSSSSTQVSNSSQITKEITKHKPAIKYTDAYSLHLGGIVINCADETSKELALEEWPREAFDYAGVAAHPPAAATRLSNNETKIVARNLPKPGQDEKVLEAIKAETNSTQCSLRRFFNRSTNRYMPVGEVTVDSKEAAQNLISKGIKLGGQTICFEPKRVQRIVRCFNCQSFGHPAHQCTKNATCAKCGKADIADNHSCDTINCANCHKPHTADSKACQHFKNILKICNRKLFSNHEDPLTEH